MSDGQEDIKGELVQFKDYIAFFLRIQQEAPVDYSNRKLSEVMSLIQKRVKYEDFNSLLDILIRMQERIEKLEDGEK